MVVMFLSVAGCVRHHSTVQLAEAVLPTAPIRVITVYLSGAVNKRGKQDLGPPYSIAHALIQAGGIDEFESEQNRKVLVIHSDGRKDIVRKQDYNSFTVVEDDRIAVPRHYW